MWLGRFLVRILAPLVRFLFGIRVIGRENLLPEGTPMVMCCNHISFLDPVFLLVAQPKRHIYFMAKSELFKNRLVTWFIGKQLGAFAVHRGTGDTDALATAKQLVRDGKIMGIFPEGTRSRTGELLRAKSGTAEVGANKRPNAMFTGFVDDSELPLAFIACIEDGGYGAQICIPILSRVLTACKEIG